MCVCVVGGGEGWRGVCVGLCCAHRVLRAVEVEELRGVGLQDFSVRLTNRNHIRHSVSGRMAAEAQR